MPIYRRNKSSPWYCDIRLSGRRRIRQSTGTTDRKKAQEYHDRLKTQIWEQERLGAKPRYTWREAVVRYVREASAESKASLGNDQHALRWLDPYLGDKYLDEIDKAMVDNIIAERQKPYTVEYKTGQKRECVPGVDTVNRFLTTFRAVLNKARDEWEWVDRVPKVKALKGAKSRIRWISRDEADRLIAELPKHLAIMAEFALQTGLRRANVTNLQWSQVDLARKTAWVLSEDTKNRKSLAVPLTDKAVAILQAQKAEQDRAQETVEDETGRKRSLPWVFAKAGRPVHQTSTRAWREALQRAGIEDFCWHDLRHTWASWHVQNGTPLHVLQELGGWSSLKMVQRYAHLSGEHLRAWVERPALQLVVDNTDVRTGTNG
ncbi:phage integrase site specific recombinase [Burkholderiales bacterium GJ-E10]|nr:phage integrase site specific recombinase [Burkholderiales bacterium GJ-E10]